MMRCPNCNTRMSAHKTHVQFNGKSHHVVRWRCSNKRCKFDSGV